MRTAGEAGADGGRGTAGVKATARIAARVDGRGGTALPVLESDGPLALRRTRGSGDEARVMLVGAMSGPLGGDRFAVEAEVGEGARLRVGSAAATIALPGQAKGEARYDVRIDVAAGGELRWLPEQLISAQGSDLWVSTRVELGVGARLVFREEQGARTGGGGARTAHQPARCVVGRAAVARSAGGVRAGGARWLGRARRAGRVSCVGATRRRTTGVRRSDARAEGAGGDRRAHSARRARRTRQRARAGRAAAAARARRSPCRAGWLRTVCEGGPLNGTFRTGYRISKELFAPLFSGAAQARGSP